MGEYATLTIWRKLTDVPEHQVYKKIHEGRKAGNEGEVYDTLFPEPKDFMKFGFVHFKDIGQDVYYAHISNDFHLQMNTQLSCKYNILKEWLLPFSYGEMKVDSGEFTAETTVREALSRLERVTIQGDSNFVSTFEDFKEWLQEHGKDDDRLVIDSALIYIDFTGETSNQETDQYIKKEINEKAKQVKQIAKVPHWNCTAIK